MTDADLENECELQGLAPAFPDDLAAVNEADPDFANQYPNFTHWKDESGEWCYIAFDHWYDERTVDVDCYDNDWNVYWWFAGRRIK